jgi:hypothetical protein
MKSVIALSSTALVAGQGFFGSIYGNGFGAFQQNPFLQPIVDPVNVCSLQKGDDAQCCLPGGCYQQPNANPLLAFRPNYLPQPSFLDAVCCAAGTSCCPVDRNARQPQYNCCAASEGCDIADDGKGTCVEGSTGSVTIAADQIDGNGLCPDGSRVLEVRPGQPFRCSLNTLITSNNGFGSCPQGATCTQDRSGNVNQGVCCRDTQCSTRTSCEHCTTGTDPNAAAADTDAPTAAPTLFPTFFPGQPQPFRPLQPLNNLNRPTGTPCDWLSEGSLFNANPHCVANCQNFPDRSCVRFGQSQLCPASGDGANNYNTGTCQRRCNSVGTGRGTGINNAGNAVPTNDAAVAIDCCKDYPGDYCCDGWGQLQSFCTAGRVPNGPICGIIIRGTLADPNVQNGLGVYGGGVGFGAGNFGPFTNFFRPIFREGKEYGDDRSAADEAGDDKKQFFYRPAPFFYRPTFGGGFGGGSRPSSVRPSGTVCSCDDQCSTYNDCCSDYDSLCAPATP